VHDDPDYSPDGQYIYFNSNPNGGTMQIWRMRPDGTDREQITSDDRNNWTPHPSPDGKWIVFLSYDHSVTGHLPNKEIKLRLMSLSDRKIRDLVDLVGGAGTMNVPSWAPDSQHFAFVSFEILPGDQQ
jgi:Tol biopolymer transport system component